MTFFKILKSIFTDNSFAQEYQKKTGINQDTQEKFQLTYFKKLWPFIKPYWKHGLGSSILLLIASLLSLPKPLFTKFIIDDVIMKRDTGLLALLLLLFGGIILFGAVISLFQRYVFFAFEQKIILFIQHKLFNRVLRFPKSFFDSKQTGYLMSRLLGDVFQLRMLFSSTVIQVFTSLLSFIGAVVILLVLHWKLTLLSLVVLPFFVAAVCVFGKKVNILSHKMMETSAQVSRYLNESLSGLELVKHLQRKRKRRRKSINR